MYVPLPSNSPPAPHDSLPPKMKDPPPPELPFTTPDGVYKRPPPFQPSFSPTPAASDATAEDAAFLRAHFKPLSSDQLLDRLVSAELRLQKWELAASDLVSTLALSPEMTEAFYARSLRDMLSDALRTLDPIDELRHVECSMPSVATEAPAIAMLDWQGLAFSSWEIEWAPHSWWVSVSAVGTRWGLGFNSLARVSGIHLKGRLRCAFSADLTALRISFVEKPFLDMLIESSVGWGVVPIPVQEQIEGMVRSEIERFLERRLTGDNSMVVVLRRKMLSKLTNSDIIEAADQAKRASEISLGSSLLL